MPDDELNLDVTEILDDPNPNSTIEPDDLRDQASEPRSTSSSRPRHQRADDPSEAKDPSFRASTDQFSIEAAQTAATMTTQAAVVLGALANKRFASPESSRWLLSDAEADALGQAVGNIMGRRIPTDAISSDTGDLLTIAGISLSYAVRNALNVSAADVARAQQAAAQEAEFARAQQGAHAWQGGEAA
jgi:hypothetical protein